MGSKKLDIFVLHMREYWQLLIENIKTKNLVDPSASLSTIVPWVLNIFRLWGR